MIETENKVSSLLESTYDDSLSTRSYIRRGVCIRNRYLQGGRSNKPITQMSRPSTDAAPNNIGITKLSIHLWQALNSKKIFWKSKGVFVRMFVTIYLHLFCDVYI